MMTLALLTLLLIMNGSAVGQMMKSNEEGFVGQDVLLSFNCSNVPKNLIWQKGEKLVNVHPHDKSIINDSYVDRTQLFLNKEKRNCSLLLRNVSSGDAGLYTSHALVSVSDNVWSRRSLEVNLTVSGNEIPAEDLIQMTKQLTTYNGSAVGKIMKSNEMAFVGQDVLLSFNCSNVPKELIWQKGEKLVNVHPHDKSIIDDSYVDRTQLFLNKEKRNCSLLLRNVSSADAGLYTSHALFSVGDNVWSRRSLEVNLTVSENIIPTHFPELDQGVHRLRICLVK